MHITRFVYVSSIKKVSSLSIIIIVIIIIIISDGSVIMLNTSLIDRAYNEITTWQKNIFLVPYGKNGRDFIDQLTKHINDWNDNTEMGYISLKAAKQEIESQRTSRMSGQEITTMERRRNQHTSAGGTINTKTSKTVSEI